MRLAAVPVLLSLLSWAAVAAPSEAEREIRLAIADSAAADALVAHLSRTVRRAAGRDRASAAFIEARVAANLREKREAAFPLVARDVERTVIDFEAFRFEAFVASGVFPKRYFGYFDRRWDTAPWEQTLRDVTRRAVAIVNAHQEARGSRTRVTDMEVAVTFIAEGGAILLRERQAELERIHPVFGVGLDDIAIGFREYDGLVRKLDAALGTGLGSIVTWRDGSPSLARHMRFSEAVLGTAIMWVYEKELAARKLANQGLDLASLPVDEQFIVSSLVYNSGLAFTPERVRMIRDFATGPYLSGVSQANAKKRWPLPVEAPAAAKAGVLARGDYPDQPTSWSAVYHVLQRWGAYAALRRFTDVFDERGRFRD